METIAGRSFSLSITVLKLVGFYPSNNHKLLHKLYGVILYIVAMIPITIMGLLHFALMTDLADFKSNDFIMVAIIFYTFKLPPCLMNRNKIKDCIHYFDENYSSVVEEEQKKIMDECVATCRRNFKVFFITCMLAALGFLIQSLLNLEQLPLNVWLPKSVRHNPVYFHFVRFLIHFGK